MKLLGRYNLKVFRILLVLIFTITLLQVFIMPLYAQTETKTETKLQKVTIQLRWDNQYQFAGYYAAKWLGYYEKAGFDVDIRSAITSD